VKVQLRDATRGGTQKFVSLKVLRNLQIPLPPLPEQKRIAAILDAADALRAKRRESIAQLDALLQSTFLEMFGDPVTNPMGWEVKPLEELGTLDRGVSKHRPRNEPSLLGGPYPLIQTGEVANSDGYIRSYTATYSDLGLQQSKMWPSGTLCVTIAANIANTGILTFDACFPDSVVGFQSDDAGRVEYVQGLFWFFKSILDRRAPQVAQKNINLKILRGLPVPLPSPHLQSSFAAIVESVEQQKARLRAHLAELDALFASLQFRAFNGEL
jgi:type I restriction enzyme S subunit